MIPGGGRGVIVSSPVSDGRPPRRLWLYGARIVSQARGASAVPGLRQGGVLRRTVQEDRAEVVPRDRVSALAGRIRDRRIDHLSDGAPDYHATAAEIFRRSATEAEPRMFLFPSVHNTISTCQNAELRNVGIFRNIFCGISRGFSVLRGSTRNNLAFTNGEGGSTTNRVCGSSKIFVFNSRSRPLG